MRPLTKHILVSIMVLSSLLAVDVSVAWGQAAFRDLPAVRKKLEMHKERHVIAPNLAVTVNDPYVNNAMVGLNWRYYVQPWLGLGVDIAGGIGFETGMAAQIREERSTADNQFTLSTTSLRLLAHATAEFVPIEGKLLFAGGHQARIDLHIIAGFGMALVAGTNRIDDEITWMPVIGAGFRTFPNDWIAITVDIRDYMVSRVYAATWQGGIPAKEFTNNLAVTLSVGFFLPMAPVVGE